MSIWCINPDCQKPENPKDREDCQECGSPLVFELGKRYSIISSDIGAKGESWIAQKVFGDGVVICRVYEATEETQTSIFKVLYSTHETYVELFNREVNVLNKLNKERRESEQKNRPFPRVPEVLDHIECVSGEVNLESQRYPMARCLVMEKIEGQNLQEWKIPQNNTQITEKQAKQWLKQILMIIEKIHALKIIHRDIHPRNIIKTPKNELVLIDFGSVREILEDNELKRSNNTRVLSSGYTPDEQIQGNPVLQSDFYALGHTFVYLLTGYHPTAEKLEKLKDNEWQTLTNNISVSFLKLIDWLKEKDIKKRPNNTKVILDCINELEKGQDLETWMSRNKNQPIDEQKAIDWLIKLTRILERRHNKNLIHRDIHPSNIIFKDDETLDLLNFGTQIDADLANNDNTFSVTREGYTPDEQRQGNPVFQSDFYALGRTFVYLLTGKEPSTFSINQQGLLMWRNQTEQVSKNLGNLIDKLMNPKIKKRPSDANKIIKEIQKIQSIRPGNNNPRRPTPNNQWLKIIAGFLFFGVTIGAGIIVYKKQPLPTECKVNDGFNNEVGISEKIEDTIKSKLGESLLSLSISQKELKKGKCDIYLDGEIVNQPLLNRLLKDIKGMSQYIYINSIKTNDRVDHKSYKVEFCLPNNNDEPLPWNYLGKKLEEEYNKDNQLKGRYRFRLPTPEEIASYPNQPEVTSQEEIVIEEGSNPQQEIIIFQKGCEIILRGQVENQSDKKALIDMAYNIEGVKRVNQSYLKVIFSQNS